jgi:TPR repeat protein
MMYYEGSGVSQNYVEAARWLHRAANQGFGPAQALIGAMYARAQDDVQALTPRPDKSLYDRDFALWIEAQVVPVPAMWPGSISRT